MVVNIANPSRYCEYQKPMDLFAAFMYLRYGIEDKVCEKEKYYNSFMGSPFDSEYIKKLSDIPVNIRKGNGKVLSYSDYAQLFFNTGKITLLGLVQNCYSKTFPDMCYDYSKELSGISIGLIEEFSTIAYREFNNLLSEFAVDNIDNSVYSVLNLGSYFKDGIDYFNHAEVLFVLNTAVFYTLIGTIFGSLSEDKVRLIFSYKEDTANISGSAVIKYLDDSNFPQDKLYNLLQFCSIYNNITVYLEKSIGITFNDRFSLIFKSIGAEFCKLYDEKMGVTPDTDYKEIVMTDINCMYDRASYLLREVIKPTSSLYVGDHSYDHRPMYKKYLLNTSVPYYPPMVKLLEFENNLDYSNIINYTSILDAHAYERIIKDILLTIKKIIKPENDYNFVTSWYKLLYLDRYISEVYNFWKKSKTPLKIDGVDPMYIDIENRDGSTAKKIMSILEVPYSIAIKRTFDILDAHNARFCEACVFYSLKQGTSSFNSQYYSRLEDVTINDFQYDNAIDAIRENQYMKVPYMFSIALFDREDLLVKLSNESNVDMKKISKLSILDSKFSDGSVIRSPYDIIKDDSFNKLIIEGVSGEKLVSELATIIRGLTNYEHLYFSIK